MTALLCMLAAIQPTVDVEAIVTAMVRNVERSAEARIRYSYDRDVRWWATNTRMNAAQFETRKHFVLGGAGGQIEATDCRIIRHPPGAPEFRKQIEAPAGAQHACRDLEPDAGEVVRNLVDEVTDVTLSPEGLPRWLLPLRPHTLRAFRFKFVDRTVMPNGRSAYIFEFTPRQTPRSEHGREGADQPRAWRGAVWVDVEELQPAMLSSRAAGGGVSFAQGRFTMMSFHTGFARVAKDVWLPVEYCNVLFAGKAPAGLITFSSQNFHLVEVESHIEYLPSVK